jgi:hypothetical protein
MKLLMRVAKWLACIYGGAVAGAIVVAFLVVLCFGWHEAERAAGFLAMWTPVAGVLGGVAGAVIVLRSERRVVA